MKWYWAILLTIGLLGLLCVLLEVGGSEAAWFVHFTVSVTAVWAAGKSASVGWGIFVLLLWPLAFPWFLMSKYQRNPR